jgi:hypothetical protein
MPNLQQQQNHPRHRQRLRYYPGIHSRQHILVQQFLTRLRQQHHYHKRRHRRLNRRFRRLAQ